MSTNRRGLSPDFLTALSEGLLAPIRDRVRRDSTLDLELRGESINVYYRGSNLLRIARRPEGYDAWFDPHYWLTDGGRPSLPSRIANPADVATWLETMPLLKDAVDQFLGSHAHAEREVQQQVVYQNNSSGTARATDYYFCDLEYQSDEGRFDLIAVHWPSTSKDRKNGRERRLVLCELKYGDNALNGDAGLAAHVRDVNAFLSDEARVALLKTDMALVFNQKRALGLIDCGADVERFSGERPMLLLLLANHDPASSRLREALDALPPSPHADLYVAVGGLPGLALFDPVIVPIAEARSRFGSVL